jgi:hypothetical protein
LGGERIKENVGGGEIKIYYEHFCKCYNFSQYNSMTIKKLLKATTQEE